MPIMIPADAVLSQIERLLNFPYAQVCRHYVAANLLDMLERHGYLLTTELASAVVNADDDTALKLLKHNE